jgi:monoamine oxidase
MDRRQFLKLSLAASAQMLPAQASFAPPESLSGTSSPKRILIIGAGLAGLVAGYELKRAGQDVIILDAQMRPGGRVLTVREPSQTGCTRRRVQHGFRIITISHCVMCRTLAWVSSVLPQGEG